MSSDSTNNSPTSNLPFIALALLFIALTIFLGYFAQRDDFLPFISGYGAFFALYLWTCFYQKNIPAKQLIALGIALRVLLLFSLPNLSDDYFRFLWDGRLTLAGYHPFLHTPQYFIDQQLFPTGISTELFSQLNSPQYYTVYPPVCQVVFAAAAWVSPTNNWIGVLVMKLFLLAAELGTICGLRNFECGVRNLECGVRILECGVRNTDSGVRNLECGVRNTDSGVRNFECGVRNTERLARHPSESEPGDAFRNPHSALRTPKSAFRNPHSALRTPKSALRTPKSALRTPKSALLYALNPLVILEIVGNCHFEGIMIYFLVAGMAAIWKGDVVKGGVFWALATATKMLPLLFLPIVWRWLGWRKGLKFNVVFAGATLLLFSPLIPVLPNIAQSLNLYFQKFQFNASVYYLVREVGYSIKNWDIGEYSGPWMGLAAMLGILGLALWVGREKLDSEARLAVAMLFAVMLYLSFAAVVQPWYVCVPFAISLFTRWRFAVVWTGLVALSYSHYDGGGREEHFWLIGVEYVGVFVVFVSGLAGFLGFSRISGEGCIRISRIFRI